MTENTDNIPRAARPATLFRRPRHIERIFEKIRCRSYFRGKEFTTDWTSEHFALWRRVLGPLRDEPIRILEIGSWEGRSAVFFLEFFARSRITCIDTFAGNAQEQSYKQMSTAGVEARFDRNLEPFAGRVEKIKSQSVPALQRLAQERRRFDLAYIDGSHMREDVMADSLSAWRLLGAGGIVIWDDYTFGMDLPVAERPQPAIDAFLAEREGQFRLLAKTKQVIVERLG